MNEVFSHLNSPNNEVVESALGILADINLITAHKEEYAANIGHIEAYLSRPEFMYSAALILTNMLGETPEISQKLNISLTLETCLPVLADRNSKNKVISILSVFMSNLTTSESTAETFLSHLQSSNVRLDEIIKIIDNFLDHDVRSEGAVMPLKEEEKEEELKAEDLSHSDAFQHIGSLLCNISVLESGRRIISNQSYGFLPKIIKQVKNDGLLFTLKCKIRLSNYTIFIFRFIHRI